MDRKLDMKSTTFILSRIWFWLYLITFVFLLVLCEGVFDFLFATQCETGCTPPFPDVPCNQQFCYEIRWMKQKGFAMGYPDGTYRPDNCLERNAIAAFTIRMLFGANPSYDSNPYFYDVPSSDEHFKYIQKFKELGFTWGCNSDGTYYCPHGYVYRKDAAVFFVRLKKQGEYFSYSSTPYFSDVPSTHPYFKYIQKLRELNITTGFTDGTYRPDECLKRDAAATFFYRAFGQ